jgi:hypothetical protein
LKIQSQGLPSFLYASKRCLSRGFHGTFILVSEWPSSSSLEHPSSSLPRSGSLSLKHLSSFSLLDGSLLRYVKTSASTALPSWGRVRVALTWSWPASTVVDRLAPPNEGRDDVYQLKPLKRYECCSIGLMVKSLIFPT